MTEMLKLMLEAKERIAETCGVPETLLMRRDTAKTFEQAMANQRLGGALLRQRADEIRENFIAPVYAGIKVIVSDHMPKHYECVGHTFRNPPPAKNRSLRLWKKLRYGKRRQYVEPIMQEIEIAFVFNEQALRDAVAPKIAEWEEQSFKRLFGLHTALRPRW